jgi:hypothetical protein
MKNYEITASAFAAIVVSAETEEDALERASDLFDISYFEMDEFTVEKELTTEKAVADTIRHSYHHSADRQKVPYV